MGLSQRNCALLLAVVVAVCIERYEAQHVMGRCLCPNMGKIIKGNITDFQVYEKWAGCDKTELIVTVNTLNNSTVQICLNTQRRIGIAFLKCWDRVNRDESRKMECIERKRRAEDRTSED
ncbi:C-X-C motif chemokine 11-like [Odontesthes bonariensis]|uniref:C-X-C motif chemokine 11-like n=1 Tax=Odontesthes bonariensis TaxID=219752 RepID=UPI003F5900DC